MEKIKKPRIMNVSFRKIEIYNRSISGKWDKNRKRGELNGSGSDTKRRSKS